MSCVPSGAMSSRQGVFPPKRQVAGSTVGVEPRTPQKLSLAMGLVISVGAADTEFQETAIVRAFAALSDSGSGHQRRQRVRRKVLSYSQQQGRWLKLRQASSRSRIRKDAHPLSWRAYPLPRSW